MQIKYKADRGSHLLMKTYSSFHWESSAGRGRATMVRSWDQNVKGNAHSLVSFLHDTMASLVS